MNPEVTSFINLDGVVPLVLVLLISVAAVAVTFAQVSGSAIFGIIFFHLGYYSLLAEDSSCFISHVFL